MRENSKNAVNLLKTAKGQIDGILSMIENDRYCLDVNAQILSTLSILKKANAELISFHIDSCINNAFNNNSEEYKRQQLEKINRLLCRMN